VRDSATAWVWSRLDRPFDEVRVTGALLGLDEAGARHLLARLLLEGEEAGDLLAAAPELLRVLSNRMGMVLRTEDTIRGSVQWSATISGRAATGFQVERYVCAVPVRDHDIVENRALAAALVELRRRSGDLRGLGAEPPDHREAGWARLAGRAGSLGDHQRLRGVDRHRPSGRERARVRSGPARARYEPALALLERVERGPSLGDLETFVDRRHRAGHELLRTVAIALESTGRPSGPLRAWRGGLYDGHLRYLPPGERGSGVDGGVLLDGCLFVGPHGVVPAPSGPIRCTVVVHSPADVVDGLERAEGGPSTTRAPSVR
jgi:hypothetical protein